MWSRTEILTIIGIPSKQDLLHLNTLSCVLSHEKGQTIIRKSNLIQVKTFCQRRIMIFFLEIFNQINLHV